MEIPEQIKEIDPQLILLDINLPNDNGYTLCSQIRAFSSLPIIFITSRDSDMDELNSITFGGDDYITKPYNVPILLERIASLLKRTYPDRHTEILNYKNLNLYLTTNKAEFQNRTIDLTKNEFRLLLFLVKGQGKLFQEQKS